MDPEDFFQGGEVKEVSADDFFSGGAVKVVVAETTAPETPEAPEQSFLGGLGSAIKNTYGAYGRGVHAASDATFQAGVGAVKGAMSTIATVPSSIGKVITSASQLSNQKQFQATREQLQKSSDDLLAKMHALPAGSPEREKMKQRIISNNQTYADLAAQEKDIASTIDNSAGSFAEKPDFVKPKGTAQKVGFAAERIAEFVVPGSLVAKGENTVKTVLNSTSLAPGWKAAARILAGAGMEGISAGAVTSAQGGDLDEAGNAAFWGGILSVPFKAFSVLREPVGKIIERSAEKSASQALGATTKGNKALSDRVVPGLLDKRVRFLTRAGLEDKASQSASDVGTQIGEAWDNVPPDTQVVLTPMMERLEAAKQLLTIKGTSKVPEAARSQYSALQNIQKEIIDLTGSGPQIEKASKTIANHITTAMQALDSNTGTGTAAKDVPGLLAQTQKDIAMQLEHQGLGDIAKKVSGMSLAGVDNVDDFKKALTGTLFDDAHVSAESVRSFRGILDKVIAPRAKGAFAMTGDESAKLAAQKEGANAMRNALNEEFPDIAKLNAEFNFWMNVKKVVGDTVDRTKSQATPLGEMIAEGAGAAGAMAKGGKTLSVVLGATGLRLLQKAVTSPAFRMTSAIAKHDLASALLSSNTQAAMSIINRIINGSISSESTPE